MAVISVLAGYLLGSIPFGLLLGLAAGKDVREYGSKNIGATNVWRVCGKKLGLTVFLLDFAKGLIPALLLWRLGGDWPPLPYGSILAGIAAVIGHNFPVWLGFKGGKGVATSAGVVAGLMWQPFLVAFSAFFLTVALSRYISLGSMLGGVVLTVAAAVMLPDSLGVNLPLTAVALILCVMIIVRHRNNISRILAGTENRFPPPKDPHGGHGSPS